MPRGHVVTTLTYEVLAGGDEPVHQHAHINIPRAVQPEPLILLSILPFVRFTSAPPE